MSLMSSSCNPARTSSARPTMNGGSGACFQSLCVHLRWRWRLQCCLRLNLGHCPWFVQRCSDTWKFSVRIRRTMSTIIVPLRFHQVHNALYLPDTIQFVLDARKMRVFPHRMCSSSSSSSPVCPSPSPWPSIECTLMEWAAKNLRMRNVYALPNVDNVEHNAPQAVRPYLLDLKVYTCVHLSYQFTVYKQKYTTTTTTQAHCYCYIDAKGIRSQISQATCAGARAWLD